jgi:ABC-type transporter Mla maintaining outer membrane lipid asymmetry permease subunit MlaE
LTFLEEIGRSSIGWADEIGALSMQLWAVLRKLHRVLPFVGKRRRWQAMVEQMFLIGSSALPMAGIMSLCTGFILALQTASELRRFGALEFVVDMVAVDTCGENCISNEFNKFECTQDVRPSED